MSFTPTRLTESRQKPSSSDSLKLLDETQKRRMSCARRDDSVSRCSVGFSSLPRFLASLSWLRGVQMDDGSSSADAANEVLVDELFVRVQPVVPPLSSLALSVPPAEPARPGVVGVRVPNPTPTLAPTHPNR